MIGFLVAAIYNIIFGIADEMKTNRAVRENQPKAQKWIAEREAIYKKHDERVKEILARYEREDAERAERERKAREEAEKQEAEKKAEQKTEQKENKTQKKRKKSSSAENIEIQTIYVDDDAFNALFDNFSKIFEEVRNNKGNL